MFRQVILCSCLCVMGSQKPKFLLQESEAQELIEMPVSSLFNLPDKPEMKVLSSTRGTEVPVIDYNGYIIWGATSMILSEFRDLMKKFNFALYYETRLTIPGFV